MCVHVCVRENVTNSSCQAECAFRFEDHDGNNTSSLSLGVEGVEMEVPMGIYLRVLWNYEYGLFPPRHMTRLSSAHPRQFTEPTRRLAAHTTRPLYCANSFHSLLPPGLRDEFEVRDRFEALDTKLQLSVGLVPPPTQCLLQFSIMRHQRFLPSLSRFSLV